jgi:hypothetical protein
MKKTFITLLALCGVAAAADSTKELWSLDFTGTSLTSSFADGVSLSTLPTSGINNGLTLNNAPLTLTQSGSILTYQDQFVFSVTLEVNSHLGSWPELVGFGNDSHNWKGAYYVNDNNFVLDKNGFGSPNETNRAVGDVSVTLNTPITLSFKSDGEGTVTMYVGDTVAGYTTIGDGYLTQTIEKFAIGGRIGGKAGNNADVTVYGASLSIIPEPTTATLSLLALAGLAARRRRK